MGEENAKDYHVRQISAETLGDIGPPASAAVSALVKVFDKKELQNRSDEGELQLRIKAIEAVGKIGPDAKAAVPALTKILDHEVERIFAGYALGKIGPAARTAIPKLLQNYSLDSFHFSIALAGIGEPVLPYIAKDLHSGEVKRQVRACLVISKMRADVSDSMLPELKETFKSKEDIVRDIVIYAIGHFGDKRKDAIPLLLSALEDKNQHVRYRAADMLTVIDVTNVPAKCADRVAEGRAGAQARDVAA